MATINSTEPDHVRWMTWRGEQVAVRQWNDTGNIAIWRRWSAGWAAMMSDMASRHNGRYTTAENYESWYFYRPSATAVEAELERRCAQEP